MTYVSNKGDKKLEMGVWRWGLVRGNFKREVGR